MHKIFLFYSFVALNLLVHVGAGAQTPIEPPMARKERVGTVEVLTDTQGVDFGPYLQDTLKKVRECWYKLIPEQAKPPIAQKGKLTVEFSIAKDGKIDGLKLVSSSGDASLDRAAWSGITTSDPLPRLPPEFRGDYLYLRFHFYYNPDAADLTPEDLNAPTAPVIHVLAQTATEEPLDSARINSDTAPPILCFPSPKTQTRVDAKVVRDQAGVNFGTYLEDSLLPVIRANWYRLVSKSALTEGGRLTVEFEIQKDGKLGTATVKEFSGSAILGKLALEGIEKSGPFPALPAGSNWNSVNVLAHFHYDPDPTIQHSSSRIGDAARRGGALFVPFCNPTSATREKGDCLSAPRVTYHPEPAFSPEARVNKYQGTVMLSVVVAADGGVQSACALHPLAYDLDKQAVESVRRWKFEPAALNGKPMAAQIVVEVDFHLPVNVP